MPGSAQRVGYVWQRRWTQVMMPHGPCVALLCEGACMHVKGRDAACSTHVIFGMLPLRLRMHACMRLLLRHSAMHWVSMAMSAAGQTDRRCQCQCHARSMGQHGSRCLRALRT